MYFKILLIKSILIFAYSLHILWVCCVVHKSFMTLPVMCVILNRSTIHSTCKSVTIVGYLLEDARVGINTGGGGGGAEVWGGGG